MYKLRNSYIEIYINYVIYYIGAKGWEAMKLGGGWLKGWTLWKLGGYVC